MRVRFMHHKSIGKNSKITLVAPEVFRDGTKMPAIVVRPGSSGAVPNFNNAKKIRPLIVWHGPC
jgi:hypothetical protein